LTEHSYMTVNSVPHWSPVNAFSILLKRTEVVAPHIIRLPFAYPVVRLGLRLALKNGTTNNSLLSCFFA